MKLARGIFKLKPGFKTKLKEIKPDVFKMNQEKLKKLEKFGIYLNLMDIWKGKTASDKTLEEKESKLPEEPVFKNLKVKLNELPFDMLKPSPYKSYKTQAIWGCFDFETITINITDLSDGDKHFLIDLKTEEIQMEDFDSDTSSLNLDTNPCIQLPIAYSIQVPTECINNREEISEKTYLISKLIEQPLITQNTIVQASRDLMHSFFLDVQKIRSEIIPEGVKLIFYGHNASGYDNYFVLYNFIKLEGRKIFKKKISFIKKDNDYLCLKIGKFIEFRDSSQLLTGSLQKLGENLVKMGKIELPTKMFTIENLAAGPDCAVTPELMTEYVRWDSTLLFHILFTLDEFLVVHFQTRFYEKLTISSLTVLIYFRHYYNPILPPNSKKWLNGIFTLTKKQNECIRESYHGGRTEVFKPHIGKGSVYDINSAYVAAMSNKPLPVGRGRGPYEILDGVGFAIYELENFFGFLEAEVYSPDEVNKPKALPYSTVTNYLTFPCGNFEGWFFSEEVKQAKAMGYLIKVKKVIYFDSSKELFASYLKNLSDIRKDYDKKHPYNDMAKRLGNALYGRFAMRSEDKKYFITYSDKENRKVMEKYHFKELHTIKTLKENTVFTFEAVKDLEDEKPDPYSCKFRMEQVLHKVAPQISAAISSYVRMELALLLYKDVNRTIAYVDTDSAFVEGDSFPFEPDPKTPGAWKKETDFFQAYIFAPKFYYLVIHEKDIQPDKVVFKISGLNDKYKKEIIFLPKGHLKFLTQGEHVIQIQGNIEGGKYTLQGSKFYHLMHAKPRSTTISSKSIETVCSKLYDADGFWIKTEPLIMVNGLKSRIELYTPIYIQQKLIFDYYKDENPINIYFDRLKKNKRISKGA